MRSAAWTVSIAILGLSLGFGASVAEPGAPARHAAGGFAAFRQLVDEGSTTIAPREDGIAPVAAGSEYCGVAQPYDFLTLSGRAFLPDSSSSGLHARLISHGPSIFWTETGDAALFKADFEARTFEPLADRVGNSLQSIVRFGDSLYWLDVHQATVSATCVVKRTVIDGGATTRLGTFGCGPMSIPSLAVDDAYVYVMLRLPGGATTPPSSSIVRVAASGGLTETLVTTNDVIAGVAVDESTLYWLEYQFSTGSVKAMPKAGGASRVLTGDLGGPMNAGLVRDGADLFFGDSGFPVNRLLKANVAGGPPVVLDEFGGGVDGIAVDSANVYWTWLNGVLSVPRFGGSRATLSSGSFGDPRGIASDGTHVFWCERGGFGGGHVRRVPVGGGEIVDLRTQADSPVPITLDDERVYWGEPGRLAALPKDGGAEETLASGISTDHPPIATDGVYVYVADGERLKRISVSGGQLETLIKGSIKSVATDGSFVYWLGLGVQKMPVTGGDPIQIAPYDFSEGPLRLDASSVYWSEPSQTTIRKVSKEGGPVTDLTSGLHPLSDFVVDETGVYVAVSAYSVDPGSIVRLPPEGGPQTTLATGFSASSVALSEGQLYWTDGRSVAKLAKEGGPSTFVVSGLPDPFLPEALAVEGDHVYFTNTRFALVARAVPANLLAFAVGNVSAKESAGRVSLRVTRTDDPSGPSFVDVETSDGTAVAGLDYAAVSTRLAFPTRVRQQTLTVPLFGDSRTQGSRSFLLRLHDPACGRLGQMNTSVVTIDDDDLAGSLALSAPVYAVNEPGPFATVTVNRTGGTAGGVTVDYATVDGSARAGTHYASVAGTLRFDPGVKKQTFAIPILDDGVIDGNKTVRVLLSEPGGGASLGTPSAAVLTIQESNPVLQFDTASYVVSEASRQALIAVRRFGPAAGTVRVHYATADGTAHAGVRYEATGGDLEFGPGVLTRSFAIPILNDTLFEDTETVLLSLSAPTSGAALGQQSTAVLSITNNDPAGTIAFAASVFHVSQGAAFATVLVKRTGGTAAVSVDCATADGTAKAGVNYEAAAGTLSFASGQALASFTVRTIASDAPTGDLALSLKLSGASRGVVLGLPATASLVLETIDPELSFAATSYFVNEMGPQALIGVKRFGPKVGTATVGYSTSDGTATAGVDYEATSGTLSFGPNASTATFAVRVSPSAEIEGNETVNLHLSDPASGAVLGEPHDALLTIRTDDPAIQFALASTTAAESAGNAVIRVTRGPPVGSAARVDYETADGSAVAGEDYLKTQGTLAFSPGSVLKTITVPLLNDALQEPRETFELHLENPSAAILGSRATATVAIIDNDVAGQVRFTARHFSVSEEQDAAVVTVARSGGSGLATVHYATVDGTAIAGTDYESASGMLSFFPGETLQTITIGINRDRAPGSTRRLGVVLTNPGAGATLGTPATATLWIVGTAGDGLGTPQAEVTRRSP